MTSYENKKERVADQLKSASGNGGVALNKKTSNLFRATTSEPTNPLDVSDFTNVINVDTKNMTIEVEGMTTFENLVDATLPHGLMPPVVSELKSITIGGAVSGGGIESSSFKYGFVHETVLEMDILLSDGRVVTAKPDNEYRDLFFGIPNSYGTLGYILRLIIKAVPVKKYVHLKYTKFTSVEKYFSAVALAGTSDIDFLDGVILNPDELYMITGSFKDEAPYNSDYTFKNIYYQSIQKRPDDYLTTADYIWRWDTDWFWCSKNFGAQHPLLRKLFGKDRLNSVTYTKIMRWNQRWKLADRLNKIRRLHSESVIQDVEIPITAAAEFLEFFHREIGILPIWVCPTRAYHTDVMFPLYRTDSTLLYINFGFWDVIKQHKVLPAGYYNKKVESKVVELGGMKSLYSDVYFNEDKFWNIYNKSTYDKLKAIYDPRHTFKNLYQQVTNTS